LKKAAMVTERTKEKRKAGSSTQSRARHMRKKPVNTEKLFWSMVRNRQLGGYKFKRQYAIGPYIADFICLEHRLIVELDGPFHAARKNYDEVRDSYLRVQGFRVLRFTNSNFTWEWATVLMTIKHEIENP
jgi:very-short-patch-repair endonuclease